MQDADRQAFWLQHHSPASHSKPRLRWLLQGINLLCILSGYSTAFAVGLLRSYCWYDSAGNTQHNQVIIEEGVPVVETAGRNPEKFISLFHSAGILVIHKCVAIRHALKAIKQGADMISMDGFECAGHPGRCTVDHFPALCRRCRRRRRRAMIRRHAYCATALCPLCVCR